MKNAFKTTLGALALVAVSAVSAMAATLNGTFTIEIQNFSDTAANPNIVTQTNSAANATNFGALPSDATITYTGLLNFGIGSGNSNTTTIANFLNSGSGTFTASAAAQTFLNSTLLSQGEYVTTTIFKITGAFLTDVTGVIRHDDGITLVAANGQTGGVSAPPTVEIPTAFTAKAGAFTLYYAAANGNPSVLNVDITPVPVPAAGFLLLGAMGGLAALRRRKAA